MTSIVEPAEPFRIERNVTFQFEIEPVRIEQGRFIARYQGRSRGYWLPWVIDYVEVHAQVVNGRLPVDPYQAFYVRARGRTVTKSGRPGSQTWGRFWPGQEPEMPAELVAIKQHVLELLAEPFKWPKMEDR